MSHAQDPRATVQLLQDKEATTIVNNPPSTGGTSRQLTHEERTDLLAAEQPAHLATIDSAGFPHVTPIWFLWDGEAFVMSSLPHRPHIRRLEANPAACICVDVEEPERQDGERPNRQVRAIGTATLAVDVHGEITRRITAKYIHGPALEARANQRASRPRIVIRLAPTQLVAIASV